MSERQKPTHRKTAGEVRHILADMAIAEQHPDSLPAPAPNESITKRVMHIVHKAVLQTGKAANRGLERKAPEWPMEAEEISVLGYGSEKVAYRVRTPEDRITVLSVYHLASLGKNPVDVIRKKEANYETYRHYFGKIIVPTQFTEVDNPWGEGTKPASIQPFLEKTERFGSYTVQELEARAASDVHFSNDLRLLKNGYDHMLLDGIAPDFGGGNLVITGSDIRIFDTGLLPSASKVQRIRNAAPDYAPDYSLVEAIQVPEVAK